MEQLSQAVPQSLETSEDLDTEASLRALQEREQVQNNRIANVRTILVVISARGMAFDIDALRQKIASAYRDAAIFFRTTSGKALGAESPAQVDLLIDFTGPGQRQGLFYARKLKRMAKFTVGRNAGFFRKGRYDRIYDEKIEKDVPKDLLKRERIAQKKVLILAGVPIVPAGEVTADRSKSIALDLPPLHS